MKDAADTAERIAPTPMKLLKSGNGVVAQPLVEVPLLTADDVRRALELVRR